MRNKEQGKQINVVETQPGLYAAALLFYIYLTGKVTKQLAIFMKRGPKLWGGRANVTLLAFGCCQQGPLPQKSYNYKWICRSG